MFFFNSVPHITVSNLEKKLDAKPMIVDVREPNEYVSGHIPGAKNIPLSKIGQYEPEGKVYVVCQSGMRSKRAARLLRSKGFDAVDVRGGMSSWTGGTRKGK